MTIERAHSVLGVPAATSLDDIRAAYLELAKVCHPDRFANEAESLKVSSREHMTELNSAYQLLRQYYPRENSGGREIGVARNGEPFAFTWSGHGHSAAAGSVPYSAAPASGDSRTHRSRRRRSRRLNKVLLAVSAVLAVVVLNGLLWERNRNASAAAAFNPSSASDAQELAAHEQRLADLQRQREALGWQAQLERNISKQLLQNYSKLMAQPRPDPAGHSRLAMSMEKEHELLTEILEKVESIDAQIAREVQGSAVHSETIKPPEGPTTADARPLLADLPPSPEKGVDDRVYSIGDGITPPAIISKVEPRRSKGARAAKPSGSVTLSLVVNPDGKAEEITVVKSMGKGPDQKAIEALQKWRFKPGTNNGVPVKVKMQVDFNFRKL